MILQLNLNSCNIYEEYLSFKDVQSNKCQNRKKWQWKRNFNASTKWSMIKRGFVQPGDIITSSYFQSTLLRHWLCSDYYRIEKEKISSSPVFDWTNINGNSSIKRSSACACLRFFRLSNWGRYNVTLCCCFFRAIISPDMFLTHLNISYLLWHYSPYWLLRVWSCCWEKIFFVRSQ